MKKRGTKLPGYYLEKPMFPCIRRLRPLFGMQDASVQTNEIILRHFEELYPNEIDNKLKELADQYKISKGNSDLVFVRKIIAEMYLINTYSLIDKFLRMFIKDYQLYKHLHKEWEYKDKKGKNIDPLNQLYTNFSLKQRKEMINTPEYYLIDYYRNIRNYIIHKDEQHLQKIKKMYYDLMDNYKIYWKNNYDILPSEVGKITYNDYFLYTRAFKYFINKLNNIADLTIEDIINAALLDKEFQRSLRPYEKIDNNKIKSHRIRTIRGYYRKYFSYGTDKSLEEEFVKQYKRRDCIQWDRK